MDKIPAGVEGEDVVLVVDDDRAVVEVIVEDVSTMGVTVLTANSILAAMDLINTRTINTILCDVAMPGGSGIELLQQVRSLGIEVPFIFLTGFDTRENLHRALAVGATDFIQKPYDPKHLINVLWKGLEIDRRQRRINDTIAELADGHTGGEKLRETIQADKRRMTLYRIVNAGGGRK